MIINLSQEPKLSAARRIVTEWTDYDEEMARLGQDIQKSKQEKSANKSEEKSSKPAKEEL